MVAGHVPRRRRASPQGTARIAASGQRANTWPPRKQFQAGGLPRGRSLREHSCGSTLSRCSPRDAHLSTPAAGAEGARSTPSCPSHGKRPRDRQAGQQSSAARASTTAASQAVLARISDYSGIRLHAGPYYERDRHLLCRCRFQYGHGHAVLVSCRKA